MRQILKPISGVTTRSGVMTRSVSGGSVEVREHPDGGMRVEGQVAPYGQTIRLTAGTSEVFMPGAFDASIRRKGDKVRLFTSHFTEASQPVGIAAEWRVSPKGVWAAFAIANTTAGRDARELAKSGIASGFSIGFKDVASDVVDTPDGGVLVRRYELEVDHVILTDAPAYPTAQVESVRRRLHLLR